VTISRRETTRFQSLRKPVIENRLSSSGRSVVPSLQPIKAGAMAKTLPRDAQLNSPVIIQQHRSYSLVWAVLMLNVISHAAYLWPFRKPMQAGSVSKRQPWMDAVGTKSVAIGWHFPKTFIWRLVWSTPMGGINPTTTASIGKSFSVRVSPRHLNFVFGSRSSSGIARTSYQLNVALPTSLPTPSISKSNLGRTGDSRTPECNISHTQPRRMESVSRLVDTP